MMNLAYEPFGDPLTAGELRNKLKGVSNDTLVYVVLDKSPENYDEDDRLRTVHPLERVQREVITTFFDMGDVDVERNLVLHLSDEFYETYECKLKNK